MSLEGEIGDLIVLGKVRHELDGVCYRNHMRPLRSCPTPNVLSRGMAAFLRFGFKDGRVDFKIRYVETERYILECRANKALLGRYPDCFSHRCNHGELVNFDVTAL